MAIEPVDADIGIGTGSLVLACYAVVSCLPCLVLLGISLAVRQRTRARLDRIVVRFGTGVVRRSVPIAVLLIAAALAVASVPFWL